MEGTAASSTGAAVRRVARLAHHLHEQHLGAVIRLAPHGVAADAPSTTSVVLVERQGSSGVVVVRMNRPTALNALGTQARPPPQFFARASSATSYPNVAHAGPLGGGGQLVREVMATLKALDRDSSVRCIVLTGSDRAFAGTRVAPVLPRPVFTDTYPPCCVVPCVCVACAVCHVPAGADIKEMSTKTMVDMSHPDHFINVIGQAALLKKPRTTPLSPLSPHERTHAHTHARSLLRSSRGRCKRLRVGWRLRAGHDVRHPHRRYYLSPNPRVTTHTRHIHVGMYY
jgi:hypothetical protein